MEKEMSRQDMVSMIVSLSLVGWGCSNLRFRVKNRHAGRGLAASLVETRQLDCPVWYRRAFVFVVLLKWSWGVLELSGRLDDRNRQWLDFKGLRMSGKILKSPHSALARYKRRVRRQACIYREVEGLREVNQWTFSLQTHNLDPFKGILQSPEQPRKEKWKLMWKTKFCRIASCVYDPLWVRYSK